MVSFETISPERVSRCYSIVRDALLAERNERGHWTGELSASALSTATAVMALEMIRRAPTPPRSLQPSSSPLTTHHSPLAPPITSGLRWLAAHQNPDGGWGDTTNSVSNVSTTMLARAVFHATGTEGEYRSVVGAAVQQIERTGGIEAVLARYGNDRTFSIPILTHCALAGLVDWRDVKPLPFELACLPARFYKTVRLPVVSYALPALIAIGQVRHHFRKPWNPVTRLIRRLAIGPSLRRLEQIQPSNGGFLEATPLTSFVTMSLAGMGLADHPVARRGVEFIVNSVRPDGSWPIDTNLATWVTTLAVNALGDDLPEDAREPILRWLLDQQYKTAHPYTNADPGGWAWTDLPGGVPDGDDTPGAVLAVLVLSGDDLASAAREDADAAGSAGGEYRVRSTEYGLLERSSVALPAIAGRQSDTRTTAAASRAVQWLLALQNRDGGWPTFCRGWGKLPFDRSAPDLTAHTLRMLLTTIEAEFRRDIAEGNRIFITEDPVFGWPSASQCMDAIRSGFRYLQRAQRVDGSWLPLWFGNQHAPGDENATYGTARVLAAYRDADWIDVEAAQRGIEWLRTNQNPDGGWGGVRGTLSSVEETALATEIMLSFHPEDEVAQRGLAWLLNRVEDGSFREPAPIGFYFARLWYFERLYPLIFTTAALRRAAGFITETTNPRRGPTTKDTKVTKRTS